MHTLKFRYLKNSELFNQFNFCLLKRRMLRLRSGTHIIADRFLDRAVRVSLPEVFIFSRNFYLFGIIKDVRL